MNIRIGTTYPKPRGMSIQAFERFLTHLFAVEWRLLLRRRYRIFQGKYDGVIVHLTLQYMEKIRYVFLAEGEYFPDSAKILNKIFIQNAERDLTRLRKRNLLPLSHPFALEPAAPRYAQPLELLLRKVASPQAVIDAFLAERVDKVTAHAWAWFKIEDISWQEVAQRLGEITDRVPIVATLRKRAERLGSDAELMYRVACRVIGEEFLPPSIIKQSQKSKRRNTRRKQDLPAGIRFFGCSVYRTVTKADKGGIRHRKLTDRIARSLSQCRPNPHKPKHSICRHN